MKVLSLLEPWSSLVKEKHKNIETRSWSTKYRGELYIHTSLKKLTKKNLIEYNAQLNLLHDVDFKYGYIIAKCNLVDCIKMDKKFIEKIKKNSIEYLCGEYKVGRYAWILKDVEILSKPIFAKGKLGIWNYNIKALDDYDSSVILEKYNINWKEKFISEKTRLKELIGKYIIEIEHIGSTSVPGLTSKPIIDIAIIIKDFSKIKDILNMLRKNNYIIRDDSGEKGEYFATKINDRNDQYYIHIVEENSKICLDLIIFRNCLIYDKQIYNEYEKLKKHLASLYPNNRKMYTASKTSFIKKTIEDFNKLNNK